MNTSNTVLEWRDFDSWQQRIIEITEDLITDDLIAKYKSAPPENIFDPFYDDLEWLESLLSDTNPSYSGYEFQSELIQRLPGHYAFLRAFHACSPTDVSSYYEQGLLPRDTARAATYAKQLFLNGDHPELCEKLLDEAISRISVDPSDEEIYFGLDDRFLVEHCGHYLLYGGEYLCAIATELSRNGVRDYAQRLKGLGTPTILVCNIPWKMISGEVQIELGTTLTIHVFRRILSCSYYPSVLDFGFSVKDGVPSEYIVRHYHPEGIRDPIR